MSQKNKPDYNRMYFAQELSDFYKNKWGISATQIGYLGAMGLLFRKKAGRQNLFSPQVLNILCLIRNLIKNNDIEKIEKIYKILEK